MAATTGRYDFLSEAHIPGQLSTPPKDKTYKRATFQVSDLAKLVDLRHSWNLSEMGCIAGTAEIAVNRCGKGFTTTLAKLWHGHKIGWDKSHPTFIQALVDGRIRQHRVEDVINSGVKDCIKLTFASGRTLICTPDHRISTPFGWVQAEKLNLNEVVNSLGTFGGQAKVVEQLQPQSLGDGRFVDKDGYIRVHCPGHPRANRSSHVYEHILIAQEILGRELLPNEEVHHNNEFRADNRESNLKVISRIAHKSHHALKRLGTFGVPVDTVIGIEDVGPKAVYDVVMQAPHHNFVANGIVVHNCYKTSTALWLAELKISNLPQSSTRPSVLYLTSKTGKTPVLELLPYLLPTWAFYLVDSGGPALLNPHTKPTAPASIYLCHYELLQKRSKFAKVLLDHKWAMAIADEAHKFKSPRAQTTRAVWKIKAKYKHLMTGSPFANNIGELYALLHWLAPAEFSSFNNFKEKYAVMETDASGYEKFSKKGIAPGQAREIKQLIARFGVRHTKKELFLELPDLYPPERLRVELNDTQKRMYKEFRNRMEAVDQRGEFIMTPTVLAQLTRLRQLCAATPFKEDEYFDERMQRLVYKIRLEEPSSKLDALMDVLEDTSRPVVVFSCFNDTLHLLRERLTKKKITYIHLEQKDKDLTRQHKVRVFQEGKAQVFLTGIKLGGESITLTRADTVVFIDREWNPQRNEQAIARCWRPGQKNAVQVFYIEANRTVDQKVEADIFGKMVTWQQVFGTQ